MQVLQHGCPSEDNLLLLWRHNICSCHSTNLLHTDMNMANDAPVSSKVGGLPSVDVFKADKSAVPSILTACSI